jgi:hypothetical protein
MKMEIFDELSFKDLPIRSCKDQCLFLIVIYFLSHYEAKLKAKVYTFFSFAKKSFFSLFSTILFMLKSHNLERKNILKTKDIGVQDGNMLSYDKLARFTVPRHSA